MTAKSVVHAPRGTNSLPTSKESRHAARIVLAAYHSCGGNAAGGGPRIFAAPHHQESNRREKEPKMSLSMYQASVPVFVRGLTNLRAIVRKAREHAEAKKIEPAVLLASRLYPDMHPLTRQIQIASDAAKFCAARLAGAEPPSFADTEATFDELEARIDKTIAYVKGIEAAKIDGSEERPVELKLPSGPLELKGVSYLVDFALPHFYFHITTAYDILRHNGVELGKFDYLGRPGQ
jgi:uncharacterized protein